MRTEGRELVAIGLNHKTAPVEIRERLAMSKERVGFHLRALLANGHAKESVILSTCNRVEIYALVDQDEGGQAILGYLRDAHGEGPSLAEYLYHHKGEDAVRHLFRVASSLDSLVLGEPQILGQIKTAYDAALDNRSAGRVLNRVMRRAISVGKKVRTETAIGNSTVSVGTAGVSLAKQVVGDLSSRKALVLGAGELAELVAVSLKAHGLSDLLVSNRTPERAQELSNKVGGRTVAFESLAKEMEVVDILVTSTAAQRPILTREIMIPVIRARRNRPLFLLDLAVPRTVSADVHDLEGAFVFNIDDLEAVAAKGREARSEEAAHAEALVHSEAERCYKRLDALSAEPLITALSQRAEEIIAIERQRTYSVLEGMESGERTAVEAMNRAISKRLLHDPIRLAKKLAEDGRSEDLALLAEAFGLELSNIHTQETE
jgi:glutamyl-tRNA reductase